MTLDNDVSVHKGAGFRQHSYIYVDSYCPLKVTRATIAEVILSRIV